jgi:hypothetical protein
MSVTPAILSFLVSRIDEKAASPFAVVPGINGKPLTELVSAYEIERHFKPAGGYGGLIPEFFKYGSLDQYFMGRFQENSSLSSIDSIYLLGCDCGEVGCWPLKAKVRIEANEVIWEDFLQPHRPDRDYSGFGPFAFELEQYQKAVAELQEKVQPLTTIYIRLLDEGTEVARPTRAVDMGDGTFRVLPTPDYDPEDEHWEFPPGSIVQCETRQQQDADFLMAVKHANGI